MNGNYANQEMVREVLGEPKLQFVPHVGYVSLFPFMGKLIPPVSCRVFFIDFIMLHYFASSACMWSWIYYKCTFTFEILDIVTGLHIAMLEKFWICLADPSEHQLHRTWSKWWIEESDTKLSTYIPPITSWQIIIYYRIV